MTSPPLVLAYALAGNVLVDLEEDKIGPSDNQVSIRDLWPKREEIEQIEDETILRRLFNQIEENILVSHFDRLMLDKEEKPVVQFGNPQWNSVKTPPTHLYSQYPWAEYSTYISRPPFYDDMVTHPHRFHFASSLTHV